MLSCRKIRMRLAVLAVVVMFVPGPADAGQWITFEAAQSPDAKPDPQGGSPPLELRAQLIRPEGDGRYPAVVMLHGCRGIRPYQRGWADKVAGWGYVTLLVDSFMTRDHDAAVCGHISEYLVRGARNDRVGDAYGALDYLASLPFVDPDRITIMGWSHDAVLRAAQAPLEKDQRQRRFRAAIAFHPACHLVGEQPLTAPTLVMVGERDQWTPAVDCARLAAAENHAPPGVELVIYENAQHGFDDPDLSEPLHLDDAWNPNRPGKRGATLAYDQKAREKAIEQVRSFLAEHAPTTWNASYAVAPAESGDTRAEWAVDPHEPGDNLPAAGGSTFDRLFSTTRNGRAVYDVPFPFEALIERIRDALPPDRYNLSALKQTLIPLGRSLQRHTASPDYFRFPRVVVAVDGEPEETTRKDVMLLRDRLFLGYQEKSRTVEVISYNELAGRFEFQLVRNYGSGLEPEVLYANRTICTSCHQNGGPLFALFPWDETNLSRDVAARLVRIKPRFYGVLAAHGSSTAPSIDASTDRANLFPVYQRLWIEGCASDDGQTAVRCRASAFLAMLQYRLSGSLHFDRSSERYRQEFLSVARAQWQRRWPYGLKVPNPDIRNREPVFAHPDIPAIFDPLNLRPPLEIWYPNRTRDVEQTVTGLSEFLPAADLKRLDRHLVASARSGGAALGTLGGPCVVRRLVPRGTVTRLKVRCGPALVLEGNFRFDGGRLLDGAIGRLELADGTVFAQLVTPAGELHESPAGDVATLYPEQRRTGLRIRFPDGRSITRLQIQLSKAGDDATVTLQVVDDFKKVTVAVDSLTRHTASDEAGPFAPRSFQGTKAMQALFRSLGLVPTRWCCDVNRPLPLVRAETDIVQASVAGLEDVRSSAGLRTFYRYCASCHRTHNRVPPNFLMGDSTSVKSRIRRCAPRILFRLSMWSREPDARSVTPMPPLSALAAHGLGEAAWRQSGELAALKNYASRIVEAESPASSPGAQLDRDYAELPTCIGE